MSHDQKQRRLGTIHHFACTGGTLISRAIAAQANIILLSEMDPFSSLNTAPGVFTPTDILAQGDIGIRTISQSAVGSVFMAGLEALHEHARRTGQTLILRDHSHSHFCTEQELESRPLMGDLLRSRFEVRSIVTVRHPLDSFIPLLQRQWVHFTPGTLEEYARRYHSFLDAHSEIPLFRYEDFVGDPSTVLNQIAAVLDIPVAPNWQDMLPEVILSGNSGRKGDPIVRRSRLEIPNVLKVQEKHSRSYDNLCERLEYNPSFIADPTSNAMG